MRRGAADATLLHRPRGRRWHRSGARSPGKLLKPEPDQRLRAGPLPSGVSSGGDGGSSLALRVAEIDERRNRVAGGAWRRGGGDLAGKLGERRVANKARRAV